MIITKLQERIIKDYIPVSVVCDRCKKTMSYENDTWEFQETFRLRFTGGYGSVFGDESRVEADICQHCLWEMISGFCRIDDPAYFPNTSQEPEKENKVEQNQGENGAGDGSRTRSPTPFHDPSKNATNYKSRG